MRLLITAVGQRTEHWTDLFAQLGRQDDLEVTIAVADVSPLTVAGLERCVEAFPRLRFVHLPHVLGEARTGHMASVVFSPVALRRIAVERPDVVHVIGEAAYLSTAQVHGLRRRRWPGVPLTQYAAQNVVMRFPTPFVHLERRAYRAIDHAFPITPAALNVLRTKGFRGPASIVPLGVDTALFCAEHRERPPSGTAGRRRFTVGFVGRLEPHKGIAELLDAVDRLGCDLIAVGDGSLAPIVAEAARLRPDRVTLVDWVDHVELPGVLARMDALVLASRGVVQRNVVPWVGIALREQFGRVLVEAMACGVPVIGSDVGEIPHVIGPAGLVFPAGDVAALTERIARLRDDPALADELSRRGVERAAVEFGWQPVATSMREVWDELSRDARRTEPVTRHIRPTIRSTEEMVSRQ